MCEIFMVSAVLLDPLHLAFWNLEDPRPVVATVEVHIAIDVGLLEKGASF